MTENMERFANVLACLHEHAPLFSEQDVSTLRQAAWDRFMNPKFRVHGMTFKTFLRKTRKSFEEETFCGWSAEWDETVRDFWWVGTDDPEWVSEIIAEDNL